jgi:hypothetical protein
VELARCALALAALATVGGCSGNKPRTVEDARHGAASGDGSAARPPTPPAPLGPYRVDTTAKTGDVQVRVEWKDVPVALRASPGPTPCGSPAAPALSPTTTWGIPEAFVSIEVDHGIPLPALRPRIVAADCALVPRVAVAGPTLAIASAVEQPQTVTLAEGSKPAQSIRLPIIGHEVEVALAPGSEYTVALGTASATVFSATTPYVAITEPTGQVIVRDVPIGAHPVRAWLPRRGALEPRAATGSVTVTEGGLAEITLDLTSP